MKNPDAVMGVSQRRLGILQILFWFGLLVVMARLAYWQLWKHVELSIAAETQYAVSRPIQTSRGQIFDRNGKVLAANEERYTLFAEPPVLALPPSDLAKSITPILLDSFQNTPEASDEAWRKVKSEELEANLAYSLTDMTRKWVPLFHRLSREQKEKITQLGIVGTGFDPRSYRVYPDASVSAHLLGFVGKNDRGEDQGYFGVEGYYDLELRGRAGREEGQATALGLPILGQFREQRAQPGRDLILTIDKSLQYRVEKALLAGIEKYGAVSGEVVVMNPQNGEILALAAFPNYDPNDFLQFNPKDYRNPAISELYEPGSTLKILTVSAGIEEKVITPETTCSRCSGPRVISGFPIRTWNEEYHPDITIRDALAKSDNTAMVFIQEELGKEKFLSWLKTFGLSGESGVDLQGEETANFRPDDQWRAIDVATASFGQGIAISSVNLIRAAASIANGGYLVHPHVVQAVKSNGETIPVKTEEKVQVLSEDTTQTVTDMMVYTVQQGDAKWAAPQGIDIAGKTGTAQIAEGGEYVEDKTIASFIGFAPAKDPQFIMLVKLREPQTSPWGSETAAPLWFQIARFLL